jgi:peptidoglycan L-alanyl-D-glutamate endopeptidase CwlK
MKYPYGKSSQKRLSTCSDAVQRVMNRVSLFLNVSILCGHRNEPEQEKAFNDGFSKVHWPDGDHNVFPSDAIDAGIYRDDIGNVDYGDTAAFGTLNGVIQVCAEIEGCVAIWGHDWDSDNNYTEHEFIDMPHWTILTKEEYMRRQDGT